MNKIEKLYDRIRKYKKQIKELQSSLAANKAVSEGYFYRAMYYQELFRSDMLKSQLPKDVVDQIHKNLIEYYDKLGYKIVKI